MAKEHWLLLVAIALLLALLLLVAVKKLHLLDSRPDQKIAYKFIGEKELTLHIFKAKKAVTASAAPAVLFFHGGGWLFGGPEFFYPQCEYLSERGFTCISAQYHLGADNQPDLRGAIEDARSALAYLTDHAEELHIDPQRIAVGGGSSGGHLAAALGTAPMEVPGKATSGRDLRPAALVLYNPILDFSPGTLYHPLVAAHWEEVSPTHHVDGAVPTALILVGSRDAEVPVATVEEFCEKVHNAGGSCEDEIYQGQGHGFFNQPTYLEKTNQRVLRFLSDL
jgi:acetyl esterase